MMKKEIILALCITLFTSCVSAEITLGSIADVKYQKLQKGDIAEFKASFFNLGDTSLELEFDLDHPSELKTEMYPKKLVLHPMKKSVESCEDCEFFILNDGKTYVRTYPVYVYVKIPPEISRNLYDIRLTATARQREDVESSGIKQSVAQVREIVFNAYVQGEVKKGSVAENKELNVSGFDSEKKDDTNTGTGSGTGNSDTSASGAGNKEGGSTGTSDSGSANPEAGKSTENLKAGGDTGNQETGGSSLIERDPEGKTRINLPTGDVVLSKEESETAIDVGIITLAVSVISLLVKVLRS